VWLPINEPVTTARFGALYGWWPPYATDDETFVSLLLAMAEGWVAAARAIRDANPRAILIANEDIGTTEGTDQVRTAIDHANERRWLSFDLVSGRVDPAHPLWDYLAATRAHRAALSRLLRNRIRPDLLGIDHYVTSDRYLDHRLDCYPEVLRGASVPYADVELARVAGRELGGFRGAIQETWRRYSMPMALTEVQLAGEPEDQCAWWTEAWHAALEARQRAIPIVGVTAWSVFGAFEWSSVLRSPRGSYEPGCYALTADGLKRTALASLVQRTASGHDLDVTRGWWREPKRFMFGASAPG
jgi:dTDP-4-dehydrorhamnose reductase